jgi:tetratricopeptide (TPR) repeat protein
MRVLVAVALATLLLAACGRRLPAIPEVSAETFPANAQAKVRQAVAALAKSPEDPEANARLGMLLHAHERFDDALACYRRASRFAPQDPRWPHLQGAALAASQDLQGAVEAWRAALAIRPDAVAFIHLGNALEALGRRDESRQSFENAIQLDPDAPAALYGLALIHSAQLRHAEAIPLLRKAVELAPNAGAAHYALGVALRDSGQREAARPSLGMAERFQRAQPPVDDPVLDQVHALRRDPKWLLEEGLRFDALGDVQQAAAHYQEAVDQDPNFAPAHSRLVGALGLMGRYDDAEKHYRWALRVAPGLEELHYNWGIIQAERGAPEAAAEAFRAALEINPASADSHFNLGSMLAELGLEADAVREIETALELDPSHRLALFHLARRKIEGGALEEGIAMLQRTLEAPIDARTPGLLYALADAYARAGDTERAILHARQALELAVEFGDEQMAAALERDLRGLGVIE